MENSKVSEGRGTKEVEEADSSGSSAFGATGEVSTQNAPSTQPGTLDEGGTQADSDGDGEDAYLQPLPQSTTGGQQPLQASNLSREGLAEEIQAAADEAASPRGFWRSRYAFLLAVFGAQGLFTAFRASLYVAYFGLPALIADALLYVAVGYPFFLLELLLAQFISRPAHFVYSRLAPAFTGLSWLVTAISMGDFTWFNAQFLLTAFAFFSAANPPWLRYDSPDVQRPAHYRDLGLPEWNLGGVFSARARTHCSRDGHNFFLNHTCYYIGDHEGYFDFWRRVEQCYTQDGIAGGEKDLEYHTRPCLNLIIRARFRDHTLEVSRSVQKYISHKCNNKVGYYNYAEPCQKYAKEFPQSLSERVLTIPLMEQGFGECFYTIASLSKSYNLVNMAKCTSALDMKIQSNHMGCMLLQYCQREYHDKTPMECLRHIVDVPPVFPSQQTLVNQLHSADLGADFDVRISWRIITFHFLGCFVVWLVIHRSGPTGRSRNFFLSVFAIVLPSLVFPFVYLTIAHRASLGGAPPFLNFQYCAFYNEKLWFWAIADSIYGAGYGRGVLSSLASYNNFHSDVVRDSLLLAALRFLFIICWAYVLHVSVGTVALKTGAKFYDILNLFLSQRIHRSFYPFLSFCAEALDQTAFRDKGKLLFGFVAATFLLAMFHSLVACGDSLVSALLDYRPHLGRERTATAAAVFFALLGFLLANRSGGYLANWLVLITSGAGLPIFILLNAVALRIYGPSRLVQDIGLMFNRDKTEYTRPSAYRIGQRLWSSSLRYWFLASWFLLGPLCAIVLMVISLYGFLHIDERHCANWDSDCIRVVGTVAALGLFPLGIVFAGALYGWRTSGVRCGLRLFRPTPAWAPLLFRHKVGTDYELTARGEATSAMALVPGGASTDDHLLSSLIRRLDYNPDSSPR